MVTFLCSLFEQQEGLVEVPLDTMTELVTNSKVVETTSAAFLGCFLEPLCSLLLIIEFVIEDAAESVHRKVIALSLCFIVFPDRMLYILFNT